MFGQNIANTATNSSETTISGSNVGNLAPKWVVTTGGDVSARAAVVNGVVYFPDWGGNLWAVNATNGQVIWSHQVSDYIPNVTPGSIHSRTSPAVVNGVVYVGTQEGAWLLAVSASTGKLAWRTRLSASDPYAILSASPVVYNNVVYEGVASTAEGATAYGVNLSTSNARGSVAAVNATTGAILWRTYTVPVGYTGGGVWGSNAVVDPSRNLLYVSTGDNYTHPSSTAQSVSPYGSFGDCMAALNNEPACLSPNDNVDSVMALNLTTGAVKWATRLVTWNQTYATDGSDDWNVDCLTKPQNSQCPLNPTGPDYDFGSAPNEITYVGSDGQPHTIIGAGQKSGIYYALDPDTGKQLWGTQVGPGSALGGMEWGSASDGKRIYVAISNLYGIPSAAGNAGSWAALDPATGAILWQTADPNGAIDIGPVTVVNGVVYGCSMAAPAPAATAPTMLALDASTGKTLWTYAAGSSVNAGAVVVNGIVYWGSGYAHLGLGSGNNRFYAFTNNGN